MHTFSLTPAPEGLFGGNLIADFFFFLFLLIFAAGVSRRRWILRARRTFHLAVSGGIVKADGVYRSLGVTAFRNLHLLVPSSPW